VKPEDTGAKTREVAAAFMAGYASQRDDVAERWRPLTAAEPSIARLCLDASRSYAHGSRYRPPDHFR